MGRRWIRHHPWRVVAVAVVLAALGLGAWFAMMVLRGEACPAAPWWSPGVCFEWWLHRYQTLIVGVVAIIALAVIFRRRPDA